VSQGTLPAPSLLLMAVGHPLRARILARLIERPSSPVEMAEDLDATIGDVSYHTRRLEAAGLARVIKREGVEGRRGHPRTFFGADPLHIPDEEWMMVPGLVREALTEAALRELASRADASRDRA
jgi:DNA-binding transcriptional ArsR family regulator